MDLTILSAARRLQATQTAGRYDLTQHAKFSKQNMAIFDDANKAEGRAKGKSSPTFGIDRIFLALIPKVHALTRRDRT
jgi:glycyl-tRNA synthetase (class II)